MGGGGVGGFLIRSPKTSLRWVVRLANLTVPITNLVARKSPIRETYRRAPQPPVADSFFWLPAPHPRNNITWTFDRPKCRMPSHLYLHLLEASPIDQSWLRCCPHPPTRKKTKQNKKNRKEPPDGWRLGHIMVCGTLIR